MTRSSNSRTPSALLGALAFTALLASTCLVPAAPVFALSQLSTIPGDAAADEPDAPEEAGNDNVPSPTVPEGIPMPDPLVNKPTAQTGPSEDEGEPDRSGAADADVGPVEVLTDVSTIPKPVARMRELIVEAAASGDIERLRPLLGKGETATAIGGTEEETDPVAAVKGLSGDPDGLEILAIMLDLLSTGFTVVDKGTPDEIYVWPYFAAKRLDSLTPPEKVDLMRLVTAGDVTSMQEFGSYNFYRIGITPDGKWKFFVGGD